MTVERGEVMDVLSALSARVLAVPRHVVVPQARLVADLGADSLDLTELEYAVQDTFGVLPASCDLQRVATVADVADLIVGLRAHAAKAVG